MSAPGDFLQKRYLLVERLRRQGGMSTVYKAEDHRLNKRPVAVKEISEEYVADETLYNAFEREACILANLEKHPSLPVVIDFFSERNCAYLVMEFVRGKNLFELLKGKRRPFSIDAVQEWSEQLLDALQYLHEQEPPVIHRDIKPENLKLTEQDRIVLLDFGLAKSSRFLISRITNRLTKGGGLFGGSESYQSFEQFVGNPSTDVRADLYSLAATLHHLLTGDEPAGAAKRYADMGNGFPDPLHPANELNPDVPPSVAAVLLKAMSLNREERPATAAVMRCSLQEAFHTADDSEQETIVRPKRAESATPGLPRPRESVGFPKKSSVDAVSYLASMPPAKRARALEALGAATMEDVPLLLAKFSDEKRARVVGILRNIAQHEKEKSERSPHGAAESAVIQEEALMPREETFHPADDSEQETIVRPKRAQGDIPGPATGRERKIVIPLGPVEPIGRRGGGEGLAKQRVSRLPEETASVPQLCRSYWLWLQEVHCLEEGDLLTDRIKAMLIAAGANLFGLFLPGRAKLNALIELLTERRGEPNIPLTHSLSVKNLFSRFNREREYREIETKSGISWKMYENHIGGAYLSLQTQHAKEFYKTLDGADVRAFSNELFGGKATFGLTKQTLRDLAWIVAHALIHTPNLVPVALGAMKGESLRNFVTYYSYAIEEISNPRPRWMADTKTKADTIQAQRLKELRELLANHEMSHSLIEISNSIVERRKELQLKRRFNSMKRVDYRLSIDAS